MIKEDKKLYVDEPCVASFFIGELGWLCQRWQGYLRFLKQTDEYKNHKFIIMMNQQFHPLVHDFVSYTIDLPKEFYALQLEQDGYESPPRKSEPGSLTPPAVWKELIAFFRAFYNVDKATEIWTPRGCDNTWIDTRPQTFNKYGSDQPESAERIVCVFPRHRDRAANRNVPEFVWRGIVDKLVDGGFTVVISGTPAGACLGDYKHEKVINLIHYGESDKLERTMHYLCHALFSISSQSGMTHISLLCGTPSYMIGHERERHAINENRFKVPASFRTVADYRAIDVTTVMSDLDAFVKVLIDSSLMSRDWKKIVPTNINDMLNRPSLDLLRTRKNFSSFEHKDLIGVEVGVYDGINAIDMLKKLSISKLYLVDPYTQYETLEKVGGTDEQDKLDTAKKLARQNIESAGFTDKVVYVYKKSEDALNDIPLNVDFVYIDGNHNYNYVKKDLELYYERVKPGGLICGHNYDIPTSGDNGVIPAVKDFFSKFGLDQHIESKACIDDKTTKDWWIFKPDNTSKINRPSLRTLEGRKDLVGIEIGVANGRNAHNILTNLDIKKLYLIDPFENYDQFQEVKYWKEQAVELLTPFSDRIVWVEKSSKLAIDDVKEQVDFVYIDGNHKSDFVREDIELYYPVVKDGGLVSGHDMDVNWVNNVIKERFSHVNIGRCNDSGSWDWWVTKSTATESTFINDILQQDTETLNKLME